MPVFVELEMLGAGEGAAELAVSGMLVVVDALALRVGETW